MALGIMVITFWVSHKPFSRWSRLRFLAAYSSG